MYTRLSVQNRKLTSKAFPGKFKRDFLLESLEVRQLLTSGVWSALTALPSARGDAAAISNSAGVELFGGSTGGTNSSSSVLELNPGSNLSSTKLPSLPSGLTGLAVGETGVSVNTDDGSIGDVVYFGGSKSGTPTASVVAYANNSNLNSVTEASMSIPRSYFAHAVDPVTGDLYAIGGLTTSNATVASAEVFDPNAGSWSAISPLPVALSQAAAATDGAGHIFVFGGKNSAGAPVPTAYRYTIATDTWDTRTAMSVAVADATAVYGFYGSIYVAGGKSASGAVKNFSIYNPVLDTWTPQTNLPSAVYGAAGVVDYNSNLDLIGGFSSTGAAIAAVISTPVSAGTAVLPQPPTITVNSSYGYFDGAPQSVTATVVGTDGITPVTGTITYTYNGSSSAPANAGNYGVIARFTSSDPNYVDGAADGTLTIYSATPTLQVTGNGTFTYNGQPHALSGTAISVDGVTPVAGTFTYAYNGSSTAPTTWGTYSTLATFNPTDTNYTSTSLSGTITIPDPRIVTGVTVTGTSTTSLTVSWNSVTLPTGATPTYNVYEEIYHPGTHGSKGSGGTPGYWVPVLVSGGLTTTSLAITGLPTASPTSGARDYVVTSVDNSIPAPNESSPSSPFAVGSPEFAPSLSFALLGGALVSQASVEIGGSVQISPVNNGTVNSDFGNPSATFSLVGAPSSMSINPSTGLVTYSPQPGESGNVNIQLIATNPLGTSSIPFTFIIIQRPTVVVTGGSFAYDGNTHAATALALDNSSQPISGTFSFEYAPAQYPNSYSSSPYAEPGTYLVLATFTSTTSGYGTATGTGVITITESSFKTIDFPGPLGSLSLDSTGTMLNVWGDYNGGGSFTQQIPVSSYTELSVTGSYLGTNVTIDLSNGNPIPVDGIVYTGGGWASTNSINVVDNSTTSDTVVASNGELNVNGEPIVYTTTGYVSFASAGATNLSVTGGSLHLPAGTTGTLNAQNFSSIAIGTGASLIADTALTQADRTVINTSSLSISGSAGAWTGSLDLGGNDLIVANGDLAQISNQLAGGYAVGTWQGAGISSSAAAADPTYLTALGAISNSLGGSQLYGSGTALGLFDGQNPAASSVLIKYTYYGDANLSGQIDGSDYSLVDSGDLTQASGWFNGDLNYDNVVDGSDYTLLDNTFNTQGASLAAAIADTTKPVGKPLPSAVPTAQVFQSRSPIRIDGPSDSDILVDQKDVLDQLGL